MSRTALATIPAPLQIVKRRGSAQPQKLSYSAQEAAAAVGVSIFTIRRAIKRGELSSSRIGGRVLVMADSLRDLLERGRREQENRL